MTRMFTSKIFDVRDMMMKFPEFYEFAVDFCHEVRRKYESQDFQSLTLNNLRKFYLKAENQNSFCKFWFLRIACTTEICWSNDLSSDKRFVIEKKIHIYLRVFLNLLE